MRIIWVAEFGGTPALCRVNVGKETDKTFVVAKAEQILSYVYVGKWVKKDAHWFDTPIAALEWLIEQQEKAIKAAEEAVIKGRKQKEQLHDALMMMAKQPRANRIHDERQTLD